jgi:hypothetical protein
LRYRGGERQHGRKENGGAESQHEQIIHPMPPGKQASGMTYDGVL